MKYMVTIHFRPEDRAGPHVHPGGHPEARADQFHRPHDEVVRPGGQTGMIALQADLPGGTFAKLERVDILAPHLDGGLFTWAESLDAGEGEVGLIAILRRGGQQREQQQRGQQRA